MGFDRKIKYLDYYENGERVRGGGFIKLETTDTLFRLELIVKGVRGTKDFSAEVILCGKGREETWGRIQLEDGQGGLRQECQVGAGVGGTDIKCGELRGIRIPLGEGKEISCRWEEAEAADNSVGKEPEKPAKAKRTEDQENRGLRKKREEKKLQEVSSLQNSEGQPEEVGRSQPREVRSQSEEVGKSRSREAGSRSEEGGGSQPREVRSQSEEGGGSRSREVRSQSEEVGRSRSREAGSRSEEGLGNRCRDFGRQPEAVPLLEDKWLQLCAIYPHIKPFQDQREYLSIRPQDFVLFSADSYKAAGNSFMLHGYYNYRHLILAREERRGEILYYVGVPGNYYDREKQVAVMFGFESFECAQEPAQSSDFGYYMMRVQI